MKGAMKGLTGKVCAVWWTYTAWVLYIATFLETAAFVFYYLGWMTKDVFQMSPTATMVITIIQTVMYFLAFIAFAFRAIPVETPELFEKLKTANKDHEQWKSQINYHATAHCFLAFLAAAAGMVQAIVWYSKFNGDYGNPQFQELDSAQDAAYIWYKMILFWMTAVWAIDFYDVINVFCRIRSDAKSAHICATISGMYQLQRQIKP